MKLKFQSQHLSIDQFDSIDIPDFVVLTGVNGSGKSHLVQAIENKCVVFEGLENPVIAHFNYETFKLENETAFNYQQLVQERESAWQYHEKQIRPHAPKWRGQIGNQYDELKEDCVREQRSLWSLTSESLQKYRKVVTEFFRTQNLRNNEQARGIWTMAKSLPYALDEINKDEFITHYKPLALKNDFLPLQIGKIYWDYHARFDRNRYQKFLNEKDGMNIPVLSDQEFEDAYGRKPWVVVNEILAAFDSLKYRTNSPEGLDIFGNFQLKLLHTDKPGLDVNFSNLSSGERVLMALVASIYKASSDKYFPDVLLLDEIDASLHPSMMKNMLKAIETVFIAHEVKVILVSHSPTTLALAPDQSIFVMNRVGPNRIEKQSKVKALDILTEGFATLDQGLRIFDEVARTPVTVITEGHNAKVLKKALALFGVDGIDVLEGMEHITGKTQLKTLFDFLSKAQHQNKVIFVWDCDMSGCLGELNRTYPYVFPHRDENKLAKRGIENAFPEYLFDGFIKTTSLADGTEIRQFDENQKANFASKVCNEGKRADFLYFEHLIGEIERIKNISC